MCTRNQSKKNNKKQRLRRHYEVEGSSMHEDSCVGINYVYAHTHVFPKCFKSLHTLLGFVLCFVSTPLDENLLEGCLKTLGTCHHVQNQSRRMRRRNTHGFLLKSQPPACQGITVATTDRSGWTKCQAEKTGDIEQTHAWARQKKESTPSLIPWTRG